MELKQLKLDLPPVLDACCGSRMMWFNDKDARALFVDNRKGIYPVDVGTPGTIGRSPIVVKPDMLADFAALPFPNESFWHVVFDPPHVMRKEALGVVTRRYGVLNGNWQEMIRSGFCECFRVLKPNGTLIFKWATTQIRIKEILALTPHEPLYGHQTRKHTHWCVFMKQDSARESQ